MSEREFDIFEPEETVGKLWHSYASRLGESDTNEEHGVDLVDVQGRLGVFFRGLGGSHAAEIKPAVEQASHHRLSFRKALGTWRETAVRPSFDGEAMRLPERITEFPSREANAALYFWIVASMAHAPTPVYEADPLRADIRSLQSAARMTRATLADCPGLRGFYETLLGACRATRPEAPRLPTYEAAMEAAIDHLLGGPEPDSALARDMLMAIRRPGSDLSGFVAPGKYRPYRPVPMWPDIRALAARSQFERLPEAEEEGSGEGEEGEGTTKKARRSESDLAERRDSLILHKFEAIFSWVESLNMNRRVEDDDEDTAKRAAEDQDELALGQVSKKTATRLKFSLDLSPEDADRERLSGKHMYPEWDHRQGTYIPDHCRVLYSVADEIDEAPEFATDPAAQRRIRAVKRQFEALRPKRVILPRQLEGDELDLEAVIASQVELRATGHGSDRVYRAARTQDRDLAISVLMDTSRSTESAIGDRMVIDVEREALAALAWGLDACGDDFSIDTFSSLKRNRVYVRSCKDFDEKMNAHVEARIGGISPTFYTRLGAAIRHVSANLEERPNSRRLLLVITDGKPNDLDHYEGRHGIEDTRMAVREARRKGQAVHGVVVDQNGQGWVNRIFGTDGFSIVPDANRLTAALPEIYRHITGGA
ncbi:VWA domain-containing protein [Alisedimentitalea sp. MJ-SS2]|uniref:nitric oxide reductase activation protein NorD n=1 Tax=Aliisedimentitalea sp. MJ-SS2 TaxID=3049795 RepID=UPI0029111DA2|nr:VWA domain-containing protein [Alisedimentitalea sp. MJ-SS2]MDU8928513.1 VWA domain-containing protein [Alisedimentitalea sp. MJ-SS2]